MKKIGFFASLVMMLGIVSCGNDDDNNSSNEIVGTWNFQGYMVGDVSVDADECEEQSTLIFSNDGTVEVTTYTEDFDSEECVIDDETSGTWEHTEGNTYEFTDEEGSYPAEVVFSNNNNTLTISIEEEEVVMSEIWVRD